MICAPTLVLVAAAAAATAIVVEVPSTASPVLLQVTHRLNRKGLQLESRPEKPPTFTLLNWNLLWKNFNVGGGHEGKRRQLADVMVNTMHADLAGFQECMNEDEMATALGGRLKKAPGTDTFNCIFYRPGAVEFLGVSGRRYLGDYGKDNYSKRYLSYAKMRFNGVEFWLFSTHWCINGPCRGHEGGLRHEHSARVLTQLREELGASDVPAIITADTNSHMDGLLKDDGVVWLLEHGFEIAAQGRWAFDMIFVSSGHWHVGTKKDGPTYPSDHPSFSITLGPAAATTATSTRATTTGAPLTTTSVATRTAESGGTSWEHFEGYNCYPGHGASDIPGKSPMAGAMLTREECRVACEAEPLCEGIVMVRKLPKYLCWLRQRLELSRCITNSAYDFWSLRESGK